MPITKRRPGAPHKLDLSAARARAERANGQRRSRVFRAMPGPAAKLHQLEASIDFLWRALDAQTDVSAELDKIERLHVAEAGRGATTEATEALLDGISIVAGYTDEQLVKTWGWPGMTMAIDELIAHLVRGFGRAPMEGAPAATLAHAVRLWRRGKGRPRRGEPSGSKWAAAAEVIKLAGLGILDEKSVEQVWKRRRFK